MEATILSQPLLRETVTFCETASSALLSAFQERGKTGKLYFKISEILMTHFCCSFHVFIFFGSPIVEFF